MAMAVDNRQQQPQLSAIGYQHIRYQQPTTTTAPQFTNPWGTTQPQAASHMYPTAPATAAPTTMSYASLPVSAPSLGADLINQARTFTTYTTAAPTSATYAPTSAPQYQSYQYAQDQGRRASHPLNSATEAQRQDFNAALDASRGMVQMSQDLTTPRNIYGTQQRNGSDGYGFPTTHSAHSSISSASAGYGSYYSGSVAESSVTDYSSASESVDLNSRTLPRPASLIGGIPPAPSTMMGQFSSKVASSSQKKHKCKICDKRFTRPSSLQTHMYSHTGEKPFACEVEGCGRHFSVVSNLRRHKKVHRNDGSEDHASPEE